MMTETVAVLVPSRGRAEQLRRNVTGLLECHVPRGVELCVVLAVCDDDGETKAIYFPDQRVAMIHRPADTTAVNGWNLAKLYASFADWFVLGADDIVWHPDWLKETMLVIDQTGAQVVGLNDGGHTDLSDYGPHYMAHRDFLQKYQDGYMVPPEYQSWWFDREICQRARALGLYAPAWKAIAKHCHPDWHTAEMDETYTRAWALHEADRLVYERRMKELSHA